MSLEEEEFSLRKFITPLTTTKAVFFIISLGLLVYSNGLFNEFLGDDIYQIVQNIYVHSLKNIPHLFTGSTFFNGLAQSLEGVYYKPLLSSYFAFVYSLTGPSPFLFHLLQLVLHIANSIFVLLLLKKYLKMVPAFFLSVLFLVHPINSEAVLYISDTQEVLFMFFGLLSLLSLNKYPSKKFIVLTSVLLLCSMLSKETGILFLPVSLLIIYLFKKDELLRQIIIGLFVGTSYLALRIHAIGLLSHSTPVAPIEKLTLLQRLEHIPAIIIFYLSKFFLPAHLSVSYSWTHPQLSLNNFYLPLFLVLCLISVAIFFGLKIKKRSSVDLKLYIFFLSWSLLGLLPHLQLIPLDFTVAERWFYFPSVGVLGLIAVLLKAYKINITSRHILLLILTVVLLFSVRSFVRGFDFKDEATLNAHDIKVSPDDYNLNNGMSSELIKRGEYSLAEIYATKSIASNPGWNNFNTLGTVYLKKKEYQKARIAYNRALTFSENYMTYQNLASLTLVSGESSENIDYLQSLLKKFPFDSKIWLYLAIIEYKKNNAISAKKAANNALRYNTLGDPEIYSISTIILKDLPLGLDLK